MTKTLMMHIGSPKTGTSFLQSVLAGSIDVLKSHGIDYPEPRRLQQTAAGNISSGNAQQFDPFVEQPDLLRDNPAARLLFSAERFFNNLAQEPFQKDFARLLASSGVERVEILLFIRDPISFTMSSFQQEIKRGHTSQIDLSSHFASLNYPGQVSRVIDFLLTLPNVNLTVRNYSVVRTTLLEEFAIWLGVPVADMIKPPRKVVNRSMTTSELMLLRAMNQSVEASSGSIADAWCNRLPDVLSDDQRPPIEDQEALWDRLAKDIQQVNARVEPAHRFDRARDIMPPKKQSDMAEFSREQITVLAEAIAELVAKIRETQPKQAEMVTRMREQRARNLALTEKLRVATEKLQKLRGSSAA